MVRNTKQTSLQKKILAVALSLIIVALIALAVFYALKKTAGTPEDAPLAQQPGGATPAKLIAALKEPNAIEALSEYEEQPATSGDYSLTVKKDGTAYAVTVPTKDAAVYFHTNPDSEVGEQRLFDDSKGFFTNELLPEVSRDETSATYQNSAITCQVSVTEGGLPSATYTCVETAAIHQEIEAINQLTSLYENGQRDLPAFDQAYRTVTTKDTVAAAILGISPKNPSEQITGKTLIFGAVNGVWEYVADLSEGANTGKVSLTEAAQQAINDPKWNGVLNEAVIGR